jgi:hypothetical protein
VKKRHHGGTLIKAFLIRTPRLQGAAGHIKHLGGLTLRDTPSVQSVIPLKQRSAFEAIPALMAICLATVLVWDYGFHSYLLLLKPWSRCKAMAKNGEVAFWFQPLPVSSC